MNDENVVVWHGYANEHYEWKVRVQFRRTPEGVEVRAAEAEEGQGGASGGIATVSAADFLQWAKQVAVDAAQDHHQGGARCPCRQIVTLEYRQEPHWRQLRAGSIYVWSPTGDPAALLALAEEAAAATATTAPAPEAKITEAVDDLVDDMSDQGAPPCEVVAALKRIADAVQDQVDELENRMEAGEFDCEDGCGRCGEHGLRLVSDEQ